MHNAFNANFYIASATVIPLFYITLTLQGPLVEDLQRWLRKGGTSVDKWLDSTPNRGDSLPVRKYFANGLRAWIYILAWTAFDVVLFLSGMLIVLAGILGEGIALWSLFYESDTILTRQIVFWSMICLLGLMARRPTLAIFKVTWIDWSEPSDPSSKTE